MLCVCFSKNKHEGGLQIFRAIFTPPPQEEKKLGVFFGEKDPESFCIYNFFGLVKTDRNTGLVYNIKVK